MDENFLTINELAARWNVTRKTLENYRNKGFGPQPFEVSVGFTRRRSMRYRLADVVAHEQAHAANTVTVEASK